MSWRTVVISKRSKLDYKTGHLVVRSGDEETRIYLDDISVLVCESTAVALTSYLLCELIERKIKVIFCDHKHNPNSELIPCYGSYDVSRKIKEQINWGKSFNSLVWQHIIYTKITNQAHVLHKMQHDEQAQMLKEYAQHIEPGDSTNREGHAAKVYFNCLFDNDFSRSDDNAINAALNYGYSILLSCFNREITSLGYLTQLGIWHEGAENPFNFSCDLIESWRPIVDLWVCEHNLISFTSEEKHELINLLNAKVGIGDNEQYLSNAIRLYIQSVSDVLNQQNLGLFKDWYEL